MQRWAREHLLTRPPAYLGVVLDDRNGATGTSLLRNSAAENRRRVRLTVFAQVTYLDAMKSLCVVEAHRSHGERFFMERESQTQRLLGFYRFRKYSRERVILLQDPIPGTCNRRHSIPDTTRTQGRFRPARLGPSRLVGYCGLRTALGILSISDGAARKPDHFQYVRLCS